MEYWLNIKFSFFLLSFRPHFFPAVQPFCFTAAVIYTEVRLFFYGGSSYFNTHTPVVTWTVYLVILMKQNVMVSVYICIFGYFDISILRTCLKS